MKSRQSWLGTSFGFAGPRGVRIAHRAIAPTAWLGSHDWSRAERDRFARERERIARDSRLSRLADVSQVFYSTTPGLSKRLTHSLEVARIAGLLSAELGLNVALAESIALSHDCGHAPFAHLGEHFLQQRGVADDHAAWGADLLGRHMADPSPQLLDGVRSHPWTADPPGTAEGEVVSWADRIAYLSDDLADAVAVGLVSSTDPLLRAIPMNVKEVLMDSVLRASGRVGAISIEAEAGFLLGTLRKSNWSMIYQHAAVRAQGVTANRALAAVTARTAVGADCRGLAGLESMSDTEVLIAAGIPPEEVDITRFLATRSRSSAAEWVARVTPAAA